MRKKGFTVIETVFAMTIFSVLMAIVFGVWNEFQKSYLKNEGKQDTNIKFVTTYKNVDKYLSASTLNLFKCYSEKNTDNSEDTSYDNDYFKGVYKNRRYFVFLISRSNNQLDGDLVYKQVPKIQLQGESTSSTTVNPTRFIYNTAVMYLLYYKDGCCGGFEFCPHKILYRYVFKTDYDIYFGYDYDANYINSAVAEDEPSYHHFTPMQKFKNELDKKVKLILDNPISNSIAKSYTVERDLVDLKVDKTTKNVIFTLTFLRINDSEHHLKLGSEHKLTYENSSEKLTYDNEVKKYIESLSWVTIPMNTANN